MTKTQLIELVAKKAKITKKKAHHFVNTMLQVISDTLKSNERLQITGFGTFSVREYKERWGVNPITREKIKIPARRRPIFSAGAQLKRAVNHEEDA